MQEVLAILDLQPVQLAHEIKMYVSCCTPSCLFLFAPLVSCRIQCLERAVLSTRRRADEAVRLLVYDFASGLLTSVFFREVSLFAILIFGRQI